MTDRLILPGPGSPHFNSETRALERMVMGAMERINKSAAFCQANRTREQIRKHQRKCIREMNTIQTALVKFSESAPDDEFDRVMNYLAVFITKQQQGAVAWLRAQLAAAQAAAAQRKAVEESRND